MAARAPTIAAQLYQIQWCCATGRRALTTIQGCCCIRGTSEHDVRADFERHHDRYGCPHGTAVILTVQPIARIQHTITSPIRGLPSR
jgi:hypothetical protein